MKIRSVTLNNRRRAFEVKTQTRSLAFPYVKADPQPKSNDPVVRVSVDRELSREGFTYNCSTS